MPITPLLKVDNKSSIELMKNPVLYRQSKHTEMKYHLVWESVENGMINVQFVIPEDTLLGFGGGTMV
jgi:hypothetical protein